jgi:hypothetical protein
LIHFTNEAPLRRYQLLEFGGESGGNFPLLNQVLHVDETIVAWLLGNYQPHADLGPYASLVWPQADSHEGDELLVGDISRQLDQITQAGGPPVVVFYGLDQVSQEAAAWHLAGRLRRSLLRVDLAALLKRELSPLYVLRLALRDAHLTGALPYLRGWDALLTAEGYLSPDLLAELCAYPDLVIVAGQSQWQAEGVERERTLFWFAFPDRPARSWKWLRWPASLP